eukprot:13704-Hanusia_phi.AAC.1
MRRTVIRRRAHYIFFIITEITEGPGWQLSVARARARWPSPTRRIRAERNRSSDWAQTRPYPGGAESLTQWHPMIMTVLQAGKLLLYYQIRG